MMANMYHEALCLLRGLKDKFIRLNASTEPIVLIQGTEAIATMIYLNDVLINVDAGILAVLQCQPILDLLKALAHLVWPMGDQASPRGCKPL